MFKRRKNTQERRSPTYSRPAGKAFSYNSRRRTVDSPNIGRVMPDKVSKRRKINIRWALLPSAIALIVIIGGVGKLLILDISPNIVVAGNEHSKQVLRPIVTYETRIRKLLSASILNRFKPAVDTTKLATEIKHEFPELDSVSIAIPIGGGQPIVQIRPSDPVFALVGFTGVYLIDSNGRALTPATTEVIKSLALPTVSDESGLEVAAGITVMPTNVATFIKDVIAQLESKGMAVESTTLPAIANELHIRLTGEGYYIKYNMSEDARLQTGAFVAVKENLASQGRKPAEYIDVRVSERVFYK